MPVHPVKSNFVKLENNSHEIFNPVIQLQSKISKLVNEDILADRIEERPASVIILDPLRDNDFNFVKYIEIEINEESSKLLWKKYLKLRDSKIIKY